jgi:hypothetical protein
MKLTIFGATGKTGKQLVEQALSAGHQVIAFVRNPAKLGIRNENLKIVQGELIESGKIEQAVNGADAVLSTLGPRGNSRGKPLTLGIQNIIAAMQKQRVHRLIIISTPSSSDPNDHPDLKIKLLVGFVKLMIRPAYEEIVGVAQTVRKSDLYWTIVRIVMPTDKPKSGKVRVGYPGSGGVGIRISRADIADFMLKQVQDSKYLRQSPLISN